MKTMLWYSPFLATCPDHIPAAGSGLDYFQTTQFRPFMLSFLGFTKTQSFQHIKKRDSPNGYCSFKPITHYHKSSFQMGGVGFPQPISGGHQLECKNQREN